MWHEVRRSTRASLEVDACAFRLGRGRNTEWGRPNNPQQPCDLGFCIEEGRAPSVGELGTRDRC